jgi:hypothetical protein
MQAELFPSPYQLAEPRNVFWSRTWEWPESNDDFIFLGEVVQIIGKLIYGNDWTGDEPATLRVPVLPEFYHAEIDQNHLRYACSLLSGASILYRARCASGPKPPMPTSDEWAEAVALSQERLIKRRQALDRFWDVGRRLSYDFKRGHIITALRDFDGGTIETVKQTHGIQKTGGADFKRARSMVKNRTAQKWSHPEVATSLLSA